MFHPNDAKNHMRVTTIACEDITLALANVFLNAKQVKALGQMIEVYIKMSMLYDSIDKLIVPVPVHELEKIYHQWCTLYTKFLLYHYKVMPT